MYHKLTIEERIKAENERILITNIIQPKLKKYFMKKINEKITKTDGEIIQKIKNDPELTKIIDTKNYKPKPIKNGDNVSLTIYLHKQYRSLTCIIKLRFNGGSYEDKNYYCLYTSTTLYIGEIVNKILTIIDDDKKYSYINEKEQKKLIEKYNKLKEELHMTDSKIYYALEQYKRY